MPYNISAPNAAHFDANQIPTAMGVIGTLGTADTGGTALPLPIAVDVTGAAWQREIGTPFVIPTGGTLNAGTFTLLGGTLQSGTMTNTGTNVNVVTGTINVGTFNNTGTNVNIVTGSLVGTVTSNMVTGTLNVGTVQIDPKPTPVKTTLTTYGTLGTAGALAWGTLVAPFGVGTLAYVSVVSIVVQAGGAGALDCAITQGTMTTVGGTNILARGAFGTGGGIVKSFPIAAVTTANGTLSYYLGAAGTAWFDVTYWVAT